MKFGLSFRTLDLRARLLVTYALLIVVGFAGLAWLAGGQISRAAQEDFISAHQAQNELLARSLAEHIELFLHDNESLPELGARLQYFADQLHIPLVLLDAHGRVLFDSEEQARPAEELHTPEINAALANGAAPSTRMNRLGEMTLYTAAPVVDDGGVLGVVQMAQPFSAATAAVRQRWEALAIGVSLLALLAVVASSLLAASLTRPLAAMRSAALRLAAGDFSQRLPVERQDEIGQVALAFNHMADQVQTMVDEQRAFAANASHELRTPLTTIRLRSEALRNEVLEPTLAHQYVAEIDDEATRLSGLVEDLILLARLDAERAIRGSDEIDMARLVRGLLREYEQLPEATGINLSLNAPADLPTLTASLNHLRVLLRNLFSNAVAYTPPGGAITCTLQADDTFFTILVTDTGQGIAAEDLPHVTERFFRVDKAHGRSVKGSGLGLTLVQSIVNCYKGHMEISSQGLGHGTTVRVCLPLHA